MRAAVPRWVALLALGSLSITGQALGQEALYGAQPPPGSAFVRFANATGTLVEMRPPFLAASALGTDGANRVSAYGVVATVAGRSLALTINAGGHSAQTNLKVAPDSFTTVLVREASPGQFTATAVTDGAEFNQARARLSFYNASPACPDASLTLAPAGSSIFTDVAPGAVKTRSVNPVKAAVRASCTGQTAEDAMLNDMEVGGSYSVWLMLPGGKPAVFITRDKTLPFAK